MKEKVNLKFDVFCENSLHYKNAMFFFKTFQSLMLNSNDYIEDSIIYNYEQEKKFN